VEASRSVQSTERIVAYNKFCDALATYLELEQNQELKANIRSRFENLNTSVRRTIDMKFTTIAPSEFAKKDWLTADSLMMHGRAQKFHVGQYCSVFFKVADMGRQPVSNDVPEYGRLLNDVKSLTEALTQIVHGR
jgi:hypothetical protein